MSDIRVKSSDFGPMIEVASLDELHPLLDDIASKTSREHPTIVFVVAHDYRVIIGLGHEESFLQFELESGDPPYIASVGNKKAEGAVAFYLFGAHHTEIHRRNLIPAEKARRILSGWVKTGIRPTNVEWEEI